ncbi:MAG TPA: hypothetical protein DDZ84_11525, partial [Firmicutes bacterium]|nr:hypothetical protein [Bacillota bacterium]
DFDQTLGGAVDHHYIAVFLTYAAGKLKAELAGSNNDDSRLISLQTGPHSAQHAVAGSREKYLTPDAGCPASAPCERDRHSLI